MNLRQQIVETEQLKVSENLNLDSDTAFLRFGHSLVTGISINSFDEEDYVDGGQDKQIDVISIDEQGGEATVYIIQSKNTNSFESNIIIQMRNGLNWIFAKPKKDVEGISNNKFKDKIFEYREIQNVLGPSNLHIKVFYITNAEATNVSKECLQETETILSEYDNGSFASFDFQFVSANEIVDLVNSFDKKNNKIDADIKIKYDANTPSLIKYQTEGLTGVICTVSAEEIARLVNDDDKGYIFDMNVRKYLGPKGKVNPEILATCSSPSDSHKFWFLNNGVTIICSDVDPVTDPDNPHIKIKNMQVVNGCQTSSTLAQAAAEGILKRDTKVLLRIYQTQSSDLVDQIVLTTNNQNKVTGRDLRSNDSVQFDFQKGFENYDLFYERKPREFVKVSGANRSNIVPNDIVATAYLSVCLKRCGDARSRKYKVWSEFYGSIFDGGNIIEPYVFVSLLYLEIKKKLKLHEYYKSENDKHRYIAKNATFHILRVVAFYIRKTESWNDAGAITIVINQLKNEDIELEPLIANAIELLIEIIDLDKELGNQLKSYDIDLALTKTLHRNGTNWDIHRKKQPHR